MKISRVAAQPSAWTFQIRPIFDFVYRYFDETKFWIDPFAGENSPAKVKNDINPERPTEYHLDALEFLKRFEDSSVDGVLYDPPYSITQAKEIYDGFGCSKFVTKMDYWSDCKDQIARIVKPEGLVLSFGWNSGGCSNSRDFKKLEILMVYHGGARNDTICVAEQKSLTLF